jgi:hypothetical protein
MLSLVDSFKVGNVSFQLLQNESPYMIAMFIKC